QGEVARPIQTLIWYPAQQSAAGHLTYGDYLNLAATEEDFKPSPEQAAATVALARKQFDASPSSTMWATANATPRPGKFPIIIYAPSFNALAFESADLCEYLASNGYIVIASPSLGASPLGMTDDIEGVEAQAREFFRSCRGFPNYRPCGIGRLRPLSSQTRPRFHICASAKFQYSHHLLHREGDHFGINCAGS
ncbi:MAG: hypothetical protein WB586_25715, partial [Chthoniobacterales bacterium]